MAFTVLGYIYRDVLYVKPELTRQIVVLLDIDEKMCTNFNFVKFFFFLYVNEIAIKSRNKLCVDLLYFVPLARESQTPQIAINCTLQRGRRMFSVAELE